MQHRSVGKRILVVNWPVTSAFTLVLLSLIACGSPPMTSNQGPHLAQIVVTPQSSSLVLGQTTQCKAMAVYSDGSYKDVTTSATWTSKNTDIASVSSSGLVASVAAGAAVVSASSGTLSGSTQLTIGKAALVSLSVTSPVSTLPLGATAQLAATGTYTDKSTQDLTSTVTWASSQTAIASISSSGLASSAGLGNATITATLSSINASTQLSVSAPALLSIAVSENHSTIALGTTAQFAAKGAYTDGSTQDLTSSVTWTSSPAGIVNLSSSGLAIGKAVGAATIRAAAGSISGTGQLAVSSATLSSIAVTSSKSSIPLGGKQQVTATGTYTDGSTHDLTSSVTWTSSPAGILNLSSSGLAIGKTVGAATISATSNSISGTNQLTVSSAALSSIGVTSSKSSIPVGTTQQVTATGTYTDGTTQDLTSSVTWTSSPAGILNLSSSGLATGKAVGATTISATSGSTSGTGKLAVSAAVLASINIGSSNPTMPLGTTQQLTAAGTFTDGTTRDLTTAVAWSSASKDVLTVDVHGVATAKAQGAAIVTATSNAIGATASLAVSSAVLSSISISPAAPTVPISSSQQLIATGIFTDGSTQDMTPTVTWNVDDPTIVGVNAAGLASPLKVGSTGVEATFGSTTGGTTLTVQPVAAVGYFAVGAAGTDASIRITNPGLTGQDLCAMTYVFDQDQQMTECCGCVISPDGLRTFSLNKDLLANPLTSVASLSGSIMFVTADHASNPTCNAAAPTPAGLATAWATHLQNISPSQSVLTEGAFSFTPLTSTLSSALQAQCSFVQQLGSGKGICTCGTGD
jgi:Bacterial Ig-like domain (group 2)